MNQKKIRAACICGICAAAAAAYLTFENTALTVTDYEFASPKISAELDGFKICHLSDIHVKSAPRGYSSLIKKVAAISPDIIAITGDLIDSEKTDLATAEALVSRLCDIAPVYFVTGNHEERLSPEGYIAAISTISSAGAKILNGESVSVEKNGAVVNVVGLSDAPEFYPSRVEGLFSDSEFNLLLSHRPQFAEAYANAGADLTLCGHAHGGQMRVPFVGGLIAPDQYFFPEFFEGLHPYGERATVISRGVGNSLIPFRINNRPEVVAVTLRGMR